MVRMKIRDLPFESTISVPKYHQNQRYQQKKSNLLSKPTEQFLLFGSLDGSIGYISPINESSYRRLSFLQSKMYTQLEHLAGLHPKAFRLFKPFERTEHNYKRNIIDGELVWQFTQLDKATQNTLSKQIGTNTNNVLKIIHELNESTFYF
jgi:cleavage and polyadenylation specificity factor subunit 1